MQTLLNTLYVTTSGSYLHLDNDTLRVEIERETKLRVPLHHISSVVTFGDVLISSAIMQRLADEGKNLVMLDRNGRFKARLEGGVSGNILLRLAQFKQSSEPTFVLDTAKAIIAGKLRNSRHVLLRGARDASDTADQQALRDTATALAINLRNLRQASDLDTLRGLEGEAARRYFAVMGHLIRPDQRDAFTPDGRSRRPPRDRMNALLSFLYSMLMNDCRSALEIVGLDPQLGCLHAVRPGRASLALDLMEEFRPILADRLALSLINRQQLKAEDFTLHPGHSVTLSDSARRLVVVEYQKRKQDLVAHPLLKEKLMLGLVPPLQARLLARCIRGEAEGYLPYLAR
ncbi:CRISPR-associated protein Cas1 [Chitinivorax tropicus]|uniref:CRISPR-associated endonuclease Cas1 n=1 Tax=Chitinivorax tropicus TaxID=714531 RepID=A0A840MHH6_9PROT|nr:type I-C CRISPR-associated endonuclease Cas1c [Chitinivorax tropicus]MBB5016975.1 CRISPR-associated protein Cas1 [Chitinivorax tropicus]